MDKIADKMYELVEAANRVYGKRYSDVRWRMNNRLTSTAGRAFLAERRIEFSSKLYSENQEKFLADTVGHEFAHIVAFDLYGDRGHGSGWYAVMRDLGIESSRCHDYKVEKKTAKTYDYVCACQVHKVSPQRKSWITRGKIYKCIKCNQPIREA